MKTILIATLTALTITAAHAESFIGSQTVLIETAVPTNVTPTN